MKEEALKLADEILLCTTDQLHSKTSAMIRRLVAENEFLKDWRDTWSPYVNQLKQTKPLSDEEIWELHQEHIDEIPCGHSMKTIGFVEFARAIEERHGIK